MLRSLVKTGTAYGLHWTGMSSFIRTLRRGNLPFITAYHRVVERAALHNGNTIPAMLISCGMLERHLDWIGRRHQIVSLDDLGKQLENSRHSAKRCAAITFDDGYEDFYRHAFPILKKKGIPATVFVVTGFVENSSRLLHDVLYGLLQKAVPRWDVVVANIRRAFPELGVALTRLGTVSITEPNPMAMMSFLLKNLTQERVREAVTCLEENLGSGGERLFDCGPLTWQMVEEIHRAGITIGSHTRTHALLTNENRVKIGEETAVSRKELEGKLGVPIRHFAYPDGRFNADSVEAVHSSGYSFAYTTCNHRDPNYPLLTIPRKVLWENTCLDAFGDFSSAIMSCQAFGAFDPVTACRLEHRLHQNRSAWRHQSMAHKTSGEVK